MVNFRFKSKKSAALAAALLLSTATLLAQDDDAPFSEFNDYKRWGYHIGFMVHDATKNV